MTPRQAIQVVKSRFPFKGYPDEMEDSYLHVADVVRRYLLPGSRILDFGSGPCDKVAVLQLLGYSCAGCDDLQDPWHSIPGNLEKIMAFIQEFGIRFQAAGSSTVPFEKNYFDMVMLHDVLEHLHDSPRELLTSLLECAKPEGLLFVTVPNAANIRKRLALLRGRTNHAVFDDYYWFEGPWRGHVREYVRDDLARLASHLDLDILELRGCDHMLANVSALTRLAFTFLSGIFPDWKDSWVLVARKRKNWSPVKQRPQGPGPPPTRIPSWH